MRATRKPRPSNLRFEILNGFIDLSMGGLTRAEALTWIVLFRDSKPPRWTAKTSIADIARRIDADPRTAKRAVASLQERGLLIVAKRGGLNAGPATYIVRPVPPQ